MCQGLELQFHSLPPLSFLPPPCALPNKAQVPILKSLLPNLLARNIIREIPPRSQPLFFSRLFLVRKKDNSFRPVLDLSRLNKFLIVPHFRMESIHSIAIGIVESLWGCVMDLEEAFFHLPLGWLFHRFFAFVLDFRIYVFQFLPFGLSLAPWAFNRITNPIKSHLHLRAIKAHSYLDDFLFMASSPEDLEKVISYVMILFKNLGLSVNLKKSRLSPSQSVEYLGVVLHLDSLTLSLPESKILHIRNLCLHALQLHLSSRRFLESLVGVLNWAAYFIPLGRLHLRPLVKWMNRRTSHLTRDLPVPLDQSFKNSLLPWSSRSFLGRSVPMSLPVPSLQLMTDSSKEAWSGVLFPYRVEQDWPPEFALQHSNTLELRAILLALHHFAPILRNNPVMIMSDNTTAVQCILRQGSYRSSVLMELTYAILTFCFQQNITLIPKHISGELNVLADQGSRRAPLPREWSLDRRSFKWLLRQALRHRIPSPQVDLFATRYNAKLTTFVSPVPDPLAVEVNAMSLDWNRWQSIYLFPPVNLLSRILPLLWSFKGKGILVAPYHAKSAWFQTLATRCPIQVPLPAFHSLSQMTSCGKVFHSYPQVLNLHAWILL